MLQNKIIFNLLKTEDEDFANVYTIYKRHGILSLKNFYEREREILLKICYNIYYKTNWSFGQQ